jgi:hypothetical protein
VRSGGGGLGSSLVLRAELGTRTLGAFFFLWPVPVASLAASCTQMVKWISVVQQQQQQQLPAGLALPHDPLYP